MEKERLVSAAVAASLLVAEIFGNGMVRGDAMARTEIAAIHAEAAESFRYWRSDAAALLRMRTISRRRIASRSLILMAH